MSHYIDCVVDTSPMARSIDRVSSSVDNTTGAVVAFKTSVIAAEQAGAEHVCNNVNRGFHSLIHSQISQKIASKQSRVEALLIELASQKKRLLSIKSAMERDYQRITGRYSRLFSGINKALKQRVVELDQPVFDFALRDVASNANRNNMLAATLPVGQLEGVTSAQQIEMSNLKHDCSKVIGSIDAFMTNMTEQNVLADKILLSSVRTEEGTKYMPVVIFESSVDALGNHAYNVVTPEDFPAENAGALRQQAFEQAATMPWGEKQLSDQVILEFSNLMNKSTASSRVKELALQMYDANHPNTL